MKKMYKNILFTTDFGPGTRHVFAAALILAHQQGANLHIVHVQADMEEAVVQSVAVVIGKDKLIDEEKHHHRESEQLLRQYFMESLSPELVPVLKEMKDKIAVAVLSGRPVASILDYADEINADLLVIGSRRRGPLRSSLLGAVAERLLRRTGRPVLVIPPEDANKK